jgi:hypothetical protein
MILSVFPVVTPSSLVTGCEDMDGPTTSIYRLDRRHSYLNERG